MEALITHYRFGNFTVDVINKKLRLENKDQDIDLGERHFKLLCLLCEASPEIVDKQTLINELWPNTVVSEWSLSRLISDTRQILQDSNESQTCIKTERGVGFVIKDVERLYRDPSLKIETSHAPRFSNKSVLIIVLLATTIITTLFGYQAYRKQALYDAMSRLSQLQDSTYTAFIAQAKRRNELVKMLESRLNIKKEAQFEKFFALYHSQFNHQELFVCDQMRAITDTGLMENNQGIVNELNANPALYDEIEQARALEQHLIFWLNKYQAVFQKRNDMCLLYVGVEDGVPYPSGVDKAVKDWLANNKKH